jgi:glycosyltransferase involved in cell wall biosynthesis
MEFAFLHPGSRHGYAIPSIFWKSGLLFKVYTDFFVSEEVSKYLTNFSELLGCQHISKYLQSRTSSQLNAKLVESYYLDCLRDFINLKKSKNLYQVLNCYRQQVVSLSKKMQQDADRFQGIYSFFMGSLEGFELMPDKVKILDIIHLPHFFLIPHLQAEFEKFSDWITVKNMYQDGADEFILKRESQELELADIILCPSELVKEVVENNIPQKKSQVHLSYYPVPMWVDNYIQTNISRNKNFSQGNEPLKILFAGTLNLRKGIQYLLPALRSLKGINFEAKIVGSIDITEEKIAEYQDICEFTGSVSKSELAKLYSWADLFVFPSTAEGSAGVVYEAMSFGLPILTTKASGSVVRDGLDGFVMSQVSVEEIAEKITIFHDNRDLLKQMSTNSFERVNEFSWENSVSRYSNLIISAIAQLSR